MLWVFQNDPNGYGGGEVQSFLNQKLGLKSLRAVNFASRFIIIIESMNFEFKFY
jgi:hypothetical protein